MIMIAKGIQQLLNLSIKSTAASSVSFSTSAPKWKTYRVSGTSGNKVSNSVTPDGNKIELGIGGPQNVGPTPIESLLAAVIGCEYLTALAISKEMGFRINGMTHQIEGVRDEMGVFFQPFTAHAPTTSALQKITGNVIVDTDATQEQINILQKALEERCPVARMVVASGCKMEVKWTKKQ